MSLKKFEQIPQELKDLPQWVSWKPVAVWDPKTGAMKNTKVPTDPKTQEATSITEPENADTFSKVAKACTKKPEHLGFVLKAPYCGIDIDHCRNTETGEVEPRAKDIINRMDSYTELSPSGTGFHILYKNDGNTHEEWKNKEPGALGEGTALEMYQIRRFFTVTGAVYEGHDTLKENTAAAEAIHKQYFKPKKTTTGGTEESSPRKSILTDEQVLEKAAAAKNGAKFKELYYSGNTTDYNGDDSSADMALCNCLAWWCRGDCEQIDRIFRESQLMRSKWDEMRGATTYGERTISVAIQGQDSFYGDNLFEGDDPEDTPLPPFGYTDIKHYKADDIGTAQFFTELTKNFMCYVPEKKSFYIYNGVIWKPDTIKENLGAGKVLMRFVAAAQALIPQKHIKGKEPLTEEQEKENSISAAYRAQYKTLGNSNGRDRVLKDIKKLLCTSVSRFDNRPELLNTLNCTYNLDTDKAQPHKASDYLTKCTGAEYIADATNERFNSFLCEICENDTEQIEALQTALGYALSGEAPEECLFIAHGKSTRNGKGTLFDLVLDTLGGYALQMDFDTIAHSKTRDASRATPDLARLNGARYILVNEPQRSVRLNESLVKQLTGNDKITARALFCDTIQLKPIAKIFITANNLPAIYDATLFSSDRIRLLVFDKHFTEEERDTHLKIKLRQNNGKSAVLNWLIAGYRKYKAHGLISTERNQNALHEYLTDNDYIQQYINECVELPEPRDKNAPKKKITEILDHYRYWCGRSGVQALGKRNFCDELKKHGVEVFLLKKVLFARVSLKEELFSSTKE